MSFETLSILQLIAYFTITYYLFPKAFKGKHTKQRFSSIYLAKQSVSLVAISWLLSFQLSFFSFAILIGVVHFLFGSFYHFIKKHPFTRPSAFYVLEVGRILGILLSVYLFHSLEIYSTPFTTLPTTKTIWIIFSVFLCCLPANIWIQEFFKTFRLKISTKKNNKNDPNAGRLIGILERLLVYTFIVSNHFAAVGFLIAAKSILRFQDHETLKTEYVLIGTMLSFGVAILLGLATFAF